MFIKKCCIKDNVRIINRFCLACLVCTLEVQKIRHLFLLMAINTFMRIYAVLSSGFLQTHFFKLTH